MKKAKILSILLLALGLLILALSVGLSNSENQSSKDHASRVKIALRAVGDALLTENKDATSLVLPVTQSKDNVFALRFEQPLAINPDDLVVFVRNAFAKASLPQTYRVEVLDCEVLEVGYSYEIQLDEEKTLIPCSGRVLPQNCYVIEITFLEIATKNAYLPLLWILGILCILGSAVLYLTVKKTKATPDSDSPSYKKLGSFQFYPEQNKLIKAAVTISLSKKECELLALFAAQPNEIITRDELSKRVWEDHGVIVGRSLDTYISKLRKKLQEDPSIKLVNVHGVGYKLEVVP